MRKTKFPWQLAVFTSELNFLGLPPTLILETSRSGPLGNDEFRIRACLAVVRTATAWAWIITPKLTIGALVLLGVSLLTHVLDCGFAYKNVSAKTFRDKAAYCASHLSVINFLLDLPGLSSGFLLWWHHALLITTNIIAISVVAGGLTWGEDYARAWHCYGTHAKLDELEWGYCMTWPGVKTPPRGLCDAGSQTGPRPGCAETSIPQSEILGRTFYLFTYIALFAVTIYVAMIPAKLRVISK